MRGRRTAPRLIYTRKPWSTLLSAAPHRIIFANAATSGGNVTSVQNIGSAGGSFSVTSGTLAAPTAKASLGGALAASLGGTQCLTSSLAASAWAFLHSSSDSTVISVGTPSAVSGSKMWLSTRTGSASSEIGTWFGLSGNFCAAFVVNGSAVVTQPALVGMAAGTGTWFGFRRTGGTAGNAFIKTSSSTSNNAASPSASDPNFTARIGGTNAANFIVGDVAEINVWDRRLTDAELTTFGKYATAAYGL